MTDEMVGKLECIFTIPLFPNARPLFFIVQRLCMAVFVRP